MTKHIVLLLIYFSTIALANDKVLNAEAMPNFKNALYLDVATNKTLVVAVGERGHVAISQDYGATWQQSKTVPTRITLTAVSIVGNNIWAVGHDTIIIHSADAGKTWKIQFEDKQRQMPLLDVLFVNESDGYAVGAYGTYLTTHDGGKNWKDSLIIEDQDFHLNKIIKIDEYKMFVVGEAGNAYRSFDAGNTWENIELPYPGSMFGVTYYQAEIVAYGLRGNVLVSGDFGETFTQIDSPIQDSLFGAGQTKRGMLLLVGANGAVLRYQNRKLSQIDIPDSKSDGDYTQLVSIKGNKLIFVGENGISKKQLGK